MDGLVKIEAAEVLFSSILHLVADCDDLVLPHPVNALDVAVDHTALVITGEVHDLVRFEFGDIRIKESLLVEGQITRPKRRVLLRRHRDPALVIDRDGRVVLERSIARKRESRDRIPRAAGFRSRLAEDDNTAVPAFLPDFPLPAVVPLAKAQQVQLRRDE